LLPNDLGDLVIELECLNHLVCSTPSTQESVSFFRKQMSELAEVALRIAKPISF